MGNGSDLFFKKDKVYINKPCVFPFIDGKNAFNGIVIYPKRALEKASIYGGS